MTAQPETKQSEEKAKTLAERFVEEFLAETGQAPGADDMVERAKSKDSPYHGLFEWDNRRAGHLYRLDQARGHLRSVKVEIITRDGATVKARAFHAVHHEGEDRSLARYTPVQIVTETPYLWDQVKEENDRYLRAFVAKNKDLLALKKDFRSRYGEVIDAIERLNEADSKTTEAVPV